MYVCVPSYQVSGRPSVVYLNYKGKVQPLHIYTQHYIGNTSDSKVVLNVSSAFAVREA